MKELTIEEKAQRYDEAIEKLRGFYRDYDTVSRLIDVKEELANLIPELREVEDEEVRKAMIDFFKHEREEGIAVLHYGVNIERMITWLEKRGEQKPAWSERDNKMLGEAIFHMEETIKYRTNKAILASANDVLSWLKSLKGRMAWKPSYEQMNALFELLPTRCSSNPIFSLYNDLKKLV